MKELEITDIVVGNGKEVTKGALVICHYRGTLEDGTEFDSSYNHGRPFQTVIGVGRVIKGWDQGIIGMKEGGRRKLFIPEHLAYGERDMGKLKPHSNLNFEIELIECRLRE